MVVRDAAPQDVPSILAIYNGAVRDTTAAWTSKEETLDERLTWFEDRQKQDLPVLVAADGDSVLGFASYGPFRPREGYRFTVEHSVYVAPSARRQGIGRSLLEHLVQIAEARNFHLMVGVVDGANDASIALHEKLGFEVSGRLPQAGTKFGRWLDLVFLTRVLNPEAAAPAGRPD
ncbi:GNAT family N-acetyltransferase [Roseibium aggregatum]|uniref:N-acetyltransferase n=1 Tax=Roseibium aggregatum TaxID=187304 RepID=A0A939E903_9HYPH|nr:GNAT family N-acetyltransferase [Roseibium aggregatum]MBN9668795.1 N-acetyltransferase [Roseibium aggregatum]